MSLGRGVYVVAAKRTAFGAFGGKLKDHTATDLATVAASAALKSANISPEQISTVICGNVSQTSNHGAYIARHLGLNVGVKVDTPSLTVNRLCGSGFQSVVNGAQEIKLNEAEVALCAGAENMSMAPYAVRNVRFGTKLGVDLKIREALHIPKTDNHTRDINDYPINSTGGGQKIYCSFCKKHNKFFSK